MKPSHRTPAVATSSVGHDSATSLPLSQAAKRLYSKPVLVHYGRVEDMTRGSGKSGSEKSGGFRNP